MLITKVEYTVHFNPTTSTHFLYLLIVVVSDIFILSQTVRTASTKDRKHNDMLPSSVQPMVCLLVLCLGDCDQGC